MAKKDDKDLPTKQQSDKYEFVVWDYIHACEPGTCELARNDICTYINNEKEPGLCAVEEWYIHNIFATLAEFAKKSGDDLVKQWLGFHLMPLYHNLVKLKKTEWAISAMGRIEYQTNIGDWKIHPIYKELRETIRSITREWKVAGMMEVAKELGYLNTAEPKDVGEGMTKHRKRRGDIHAVEKIEGTYRKRS